MNIIFKAKSTSTGEVVTGTSLVNETAGYVIANTMEHVDSNEWNVGKRTWDYIDITTLEIITNA